MSNESDAASLLKRIAVNQAGSSFDLTSWIMNGLNLQPGSRVLEWCCGTGEQTLPLLEAVGPEGCVWALDVSTDALTELRRKIPEGFVVLLNANMDRILRIAETRFDMVFCAYGLYYAASAAMVLNDATMQLKPNGRIVIVGPYGLNNAMLFNVLQSAGVRIAKDVRYSSQDFMMQEVVPWAVENMAEVRIRTVRNQVRFREPASVLAYWQHSTFYDSEKEQAVQDTLDAYFKVNPELVNDKWIMMVEMRCAS